jgi:phage tail-like protein
MQRAAIERMLPSIFQRAIAERSPLIALLEVMETLHAPAEEMLSRLPDVFAARRTDTRFLTMLAHWLNLDWLYPQTHVGSKSLNWQPMLPPIAPGRLRELISKAPSIAQLRGTSGGLQLFLEIVTGEGPFRLEEKVADEEGALIPFHVRVLAPRSTQVYQELIERIVENEKPAYVTWDLVWV